MRRGIAVLMMLLMGLLGGCTSQEQMLEPAIAFRAELVEAGGCTFTAVVTAEYEDCVQSFTLDCRLDAQGVLHQVITAPESLEGISSTVSEEGGKLTYEGMALGFGLLAGGNVSPAAAAGVAACSWRSAYIAAACQEEAGYRVTYEKNYGQKSLIVDTWFKNEVPFYAEVCYNGTRILRLEVSSFKMTEES